MSSDGRPDVRRAREEGQWRDKAVLTAAWGLAAPSHRAGQLCTDRVYSLGKRTVAQGSIRKHLPPDPVYVLAGDAAGLRDLTPGASVPVQQGAEHTALRVEPGARPGLGRHLRCL